MKRLSANLCLGVLCLLLVCCSKKSSTHGPVYHAVVLGPDLNCGKYAIKFSSEDTAAIKDILKDSSFSGAYIAQNLPEALQVKALEILVTIRKPASSEISACITFGPSLPWIYILTAEKK